MYISLVKLFKETSTFIVTDYLEQQIFSEKMLICIC